VEVWVVKAVSAGLVDGKMSQDRRAVTFSRSVQREFTDVQWTRLKDRMESWVGSVGGLLKTIGADGST
jgi:translation initiation factor 3 subunit M